MGRTRDVWEKLGTLDLAKRLNLTLMPLDELPAETMASRRTQNFPLETRCRSPQVC